MITRVARNDVVRVSRTGEVGLVKGWADHENLAANGTILDVQVGRGQTIQANGSALEYVARAKVEYTPFKRVWWTFLFLFSIAYGVYFGWNISRHGSGVMSGVFVGLSSSVFLFYVLKVSTLLPRRTRITLPKPKQGANVRVKGNGNVTAGRNIKF